MAKQEQAPAERKVPGKRPVLQFRVHPEMYEDIRQSAEKGSLTISEEASRRLEEYKRLNSGWLQSHMLTDYTIDYATAVIQANIESALERYGYTKLSLRDDVVWAPPGANIQSIASTLDLAAKLQLSDGEFVKALAKQIAANIVLPWHRATEGKSDEG